jgi:hypothetical protein
MEKKLKPVHLIHLLLYAPTTMDNKPVPIFGRTRLMKMLFIFEKELSGYFQNDDTKIGFDFEAHNFGPFSKKVYEAIDFLETRDIIELFPISSHWMSRDEMEIDSILMASEDRVLNFQDEYVPKSEGYRLTSRGIEMIKNQDIWFSWPKLSEKGKSVLVDFKTTMINTPLKDILKYVYSKYPKYAEKSIIYHKLFPDGVFQ